MVGSQSSNLDQPYQDAQACIKHRKDQLLHTSNRARCVSTFDLPGVRLQCTGISGRGRLHQMTGAPSRDAGKQGAASIVHIHLQQPGHMSGIIQVILLICSHPSTRGFNCTYQILTCGLKLSQLRRKHVFLLTCTKHPGPSQDASVLCTRSCPHWIMAQSLCASTQRLCGSPEISMARPWQLHCPTH